MHAIEAIGLTKTFRDTRAVDGIDLRVGEGELVAMLGANGAGKTTTLMMLLGITEPDGGEIHLLGHRLPQGRVRALEQVGFAASYLDIPHRISVRRILEITARVYGAPLSRIGEVADLFGVERFLKRTKAQLSSGQRTLVGLARAVISRPRILILDEPTASLDPDVAQRVRQTLKRIQADEGFTLLVTSHNMADVERLCRRVVFLSRGRVVADGTPDQITRRFGVGSLEDTFVHVASGGGG